ncbi:ferritin-like domain-containing protein [Nocardioides sp. R-C-SC26]|uniref:ferritin-like domain-containing protein n=1 Tax=Nocardioides sp. R-C-SC26 TaxID=2870414 RepID=UPI001E54BABC|nr:ferritin-like domain-containing protein [Nocardioides sp. R-C-SC26]
MSRSEESPEVNAVQQTLAAEHAAVFLFGYLGAQTSQSSAPALFAAVSAAFEIHRGRRDELVAAVSALDVVPVPAAPSYDLPTVRQRPVAIATAALAAEDACARAYGVLVSMSTGVTRAWAIRALTDSALRSLDFGGEPTAFPGS